MKIYLDIDGTLLNPDGTSARCLYEFLEYVTGAHECYWLTTHCKGDAKTAEEYLRMKKLDEYAFKFISRIKPTNWDILKTDAIDMTEDFIWFDDSPMVHELLALKKAGKSGSLHHINLKDNPYALCEELDNLS
jgi:hypothetical protein